MPQAEMLPDTIQPSADQSQGIMSLEGRLMEVLNTGVIPFTCPQALLLSLIILTWGLWKHLHLS